MRVGLVGRCQAPIASSALSAKLAEAASRQAYLVDAKWGRM